MKIRYENTVEDLVAFNHFHCEHSPSVKRMRVRAVWSVVAALLTVAAALALAMENLWVLGWGMAVAGILAFLLPGSFRRQVDRQARQLYAEGANKGMVGPHELELVGNELIARSPVGESRVRLEAIERVVTDGGYIFIYLSALTAHVVPRISVTEGDSEAFVEALKRRMAPSPTSTEP